MNAVPDKIHALLGPSGWDWWSNCPGAPHLTKDMPNTTSPYAAEGTVAHEVADRCLRENAHPSNFLGDMFTCDGYDIVVDEEMVGAVDDYLTYIHDLAAGDAVILPEQSVPIGHLTGETGAHGTSDCIVLSADGKTMHVIDLKYGKGVRVNAAGNGQGRLYALGALHKLAAVYEDVEEVEIHIVMPRLEDGISSEVLTMGEMQEHSDLVETAAGRVAMCADEPELVPGEKQCRFCAAKGVCPALQDTVSTELALVSGATLDDFADLTSPEPVIAPDVSSDKLADFLRAVPLIESAIAGVRAEVERRLFAGDDVPGFYLGVGRKGNRAWGDEEAAEKILKRKLKAAGTYAPRKIISVAQAQKKIKDPKVWAQLDKLVSQAEGKPSVSQDGDKNPPYEISTATDFADLSVETEAQRLLG